MSNQELIFHDPITQGELEVVVMDNGDVLIPTINFIIPAQEIHSLAFLFGDSEVKDRLLQSKDTIVRPYKKQHMVRIKKDMKAGETVIVNCIVNIPVEIENKIKEELQNNGKTK